MNMDLQRVFTYRAQFQIGAQSVSILEIDTSSSFNTTE